MTAGGAGSVRRLLRDLSRVASRRRGLLAGALAAGAVATALPALAPPPVEGIRVVTASRDLAGGSGLLAEDLGTVELPRTLVPDGALTSTAPAVGRTLAGAVRRGEALTDVRLVGARLLTGLTAGQVAVPVRLADPAAAALLGAGDRIDVLAARAEEPGARVVGADVLVLAVPAVTEFAGDGALVVVAATSATATRLAGAAVDERLSAVLRP